MELSEAIEITRVRDAFMRKGPRPSQQGELCIFGHHLIFAPSGTETSKSGENPSEEFWILHRAIDRVLCEPVSKEYPSKGGLLALKCKNFLIIIFEVANLEHCKAAARSIEALSNLNGIVHDYPFFYQVPFNVLDDGWISFDVEQEFARLSLLTDAFRISRVNEHFSICPSYPTTVIVPKGIGDDYLRISATFREGGRFPVFCYYHNLTKSVIMRCGQPLIGPTNRRCREDEVIINSLLTISKGFIIDTRSKTVANAAKAKGGGTEPQGCYAQFRYVHCATPRIKEMHDALARMVEACNDGSVSTDKWLMRLSNSGWLQCISDCLNSAANVAQCVHCESNREVPVIVHGGEGTDTTLITTSLAQLILDSDARTIRGFESLIEREWITAGHPFRLRNAHGAFAAGLNTGQYESPVFLVFLDCVHQLLSQFPLTFEFTESFLIFLFEHAYASEFGSFLGNNEKEKFKNEVKKRTVSLWSYIHHPETLRQFINPLYDPRPKVLWPTVAPQSILIWERLFFRWQRDWAEIDGIRSSSEHWKLRERSLMSRAAVLRGVTIELSKEAANQNVNGVIGISQ
ncbi:unnamed protein product [Caenorhabditis auriculariae]|uniref:Myotubularin phosphatase domain-containing protein n=1 Tax=Caenorhabditis auriculariae TaxID=2777116 RepID=A0A8S1GW44_9PELO|nr:unnamed protein product [Caenorhabditis auriculariae]